MKHITSRQNPLVSRYRAVADGEDRTQLLLDGPHLVGDALEVGVELVHAVVTPESLARPEVSALAVQLEDAGVEVVSVAAPVMNALSPVRSSSAIVALALRPRIADAGLFTQPTPMIVCAVGVQDPGNLGAITRVAEAGGATALVVAGRSADPYGWKALRGSMGSALRLPIVHGADASAFIADARRHRCHIVASVPRGGLPPERSTLHGAVVLLVGGEGPGLPADLVAAADSLVTIPMAPPVESLNTAVCAALLVYEARRQRLTHTAHGLAVSRRS